MMNRVIAGAVSLALLAAPGAASAETIHLKFASGSPPTIDINKMLFTPWIDEINGAGKNVLEVENTANALLSVATLFDGLKHGVVDIGWIVEGFVPGQFKRSLVAQLPFESDSGEEASIALTNLYQSGVIAADYKDFHVLAVHGFPQFALNSKNKIVKLEDFRGVKTRISGKIFADEVQALGGTPVSLPPVEAYQYLSRGTVTADLVAYTAVCNFRVNEATTYHLNGPFGGTTAAFLVNRQTWDKLPDAAKKILDDHGGMRLSRFAGKTLDGIADTCKRKVAAQPGSVMTELRKNPAEFARWRKRLVPVVDAAMKDTPNGQQVLDAFRKEIAAVRKDNR